MKFFYNLKRNDKPGFCKAKSARKAAGLNLIELQRFRRGNPILDFFLNKENQGSYQLHQNILESWYNILLARFCARILCARKIWDKRLSRGQTMIEFTFCLIVILLMIYGLMKVFQWTGRDQALRRIAHDDLITAPVQHSYSDIWKGPAKQMDPYFYTPIRLNAVWNGT